MQSLVLTGGAGRPRRYRQGHGHRRYRQGHGPKLQKFKGFMKKAASFGSSTSYLIYKKLAQTPYWT